MTLPTGTVTFLFTDIEGSTKLMQDVGDRYVAAQTAHHDILRAAFTGSRGRELRTEGDSFFAVFESAVDACGAAAAAQTAFAQHEWPEGVELRVRMGMHTGEAPLVGNEYIGLDVHHAARVASAAHGGQVVVSETTRALVDEHLSDGLSLRDLGTHRLKDLARPERLYQLLIPGARDQFPALRTLDSTPNNPPTQLTSFIGRDQDVAEAKRLLRGTRLLTLTGPGGIGKTRLSLQLAADVVQEFPGGVYFVPLSAVTDAGLIPSVLAHTLGVPVAGTRTPQEVALEYLSDKTVLLVLDNFEQLLPDGATVVSDLLHGASGLKAVVSSRAVLHVYGEQELAVQPLRLPDMRALPSLAALSQYEAVKLFIERAVAVRPDFEATDLGLDVLEGLDERADQSLLRRMPDFEEPRLLMLQVVREYALERLDESGEHDAVCRRHAAAYVALAEVAEPDYFGARQKETLDRLELDHDNFRSAFDYVIGSGDAESAMRLGWSLWRFWQMRGHLPEGRALLDRILAMPGASDHRQRRMKALEALGGIAYWQGDMPGAQVYYDECLAEARASGDKRALTNALYNASFPVPVSRLDVTRGRALLEEAVPLFRELGDQRGLSQVLWGLGNLLSYEDRLDEAATALEEAIAAFRSTDNRFGLAWALHTAATVAIKRREAAAAAPLVNESLRIFSEAGDVAGIVVLLDDTAALAQLRGDMRRALRLGGAAAAHRATTGAGLGMIIGLEQGWTWQDSLTDETRRKAWAEGGALSIDQAVAEALASDEAVEAGA